MTGGRDDCREPSNKNITVGEDALVLIAELLYQMMRDDRRLARYFRFLDLVAFASCLRRFLLRVFDGREWPSMRISAKLLRSSYDGFVDALLECLKRPIPLGADVMTTGMDAFCDEKLDDHRVWQFMESIRLMSCVLEDPGCISSCAVNMAGSKDGDDYVDLLAGEDAFVATADLLYRHLRADVRFIRYFRYADIVAIASSLRRLLSGAFDGGDWPHVRFSKGLLASTYEGFASALLECIDRPIPLGADIIATGLDVLCTEKWKDRRVQRFMANIREKSWRPPGTGPVAATLCGQKHWNSEDAVEVVWNWVRDWFD